MLKQHLQLSGGSCTSICPNPHWIGKGTIDGFRKLHISTTTYICNQVWTMAVAAEWVWSLPGRLVVQECVGPEGIWNSGAHAKSVDHVSGWSHKPHVGISILPHLWKSLFVVIPPVNGSEGVHAGLNASGLQASDYSKSILVNCGCDSTMMFERRYYNVDGAAPQVEGMESLSMENAHITCWHTSIRKHLQTYWSRHVSRWRWHHDNGRHLLWKLCYWMILIALPDAYANSDASCESSGWSDKLWVNFWVGYAKLSRIGFMRQFITFWQFLILC